MTRSFPYQPPRGTARRLGEPRCFGGLAGERVAEPVDGPDVPCVSRVLADRFADLRDEARERRLRDERVRPDLLVNLRFRQRAGPALKQQLQQAERLGGEVDGTSAPEELPGLSVEDAVSEDDPHRGSQRIPEKSPDNSKDSPPGKREPADRAGDGIPPLPAAEIEGRKS
jgi:hypothetical protein